MSWAYLSLMGRGRLMFLEKHPMIRFVRVKLIRSVAVIKGAFTAKPKQESVPAVNPWEADLAEACPRTKERSSVRDHS